MEKKKSKAIYIICMLAVLIATGLIITALIMGDFDLKEALSGKIRMETIYILLVFFLLLPLLLLLLAMFIRGDNKRKKKPQVLNVSNISLNGAQTTIQAPVMAQTKKENSEDEDGAGRF